ncbi:fructose-specific PTS transporter subunit EIIC [Streptomyces bambusae]|uniref:fructose-specific PTS transporter subunit EIIC n=1 Tax=Streptomyces bambusae TaxID=1550616 RepID=UPI0027DF506D|nr:fructose-specific PTS transporter subunit EIIC [Streptomyces bambusae]
MTSPAGLRAKADPSGRRLRLLAVTACPTGIAHTYMAAETLQQTAERLGIDMKVETQGSIGAENVLTDNDVRQADGIIIAADKEVDRERFAGKRVLSTGVADGIHRPEELIEQVQRAPVQSGTAAPAGGSGAGSAGATGGAGGWGGSGRSGGRERSLGYKALMNGVSYMIPFVVVGGLLIAVSLALGGHATASGYATTPGTFWDHLFRIGVLGFTLMIPILSGYIAYAIGDRPALVPGMIGGFIANTGSLYDSKAGAGFIGAIVTGFLAGYLVVWIKKVQVPKVVQPIMPIIVIPIAATTALGLFFIYVIGKPISWVFENLTGWLSGMTGTSAVLLGAILGLMIAFDMGGPVNKTAFLFGAGLIASGNHAVMGMCAAAIPVMPLGQGLATVLRRRLYSEQERDTGMAALFMGVFGISEGAIPFAAARPAVVIPANMLGGAVAGALAGVAGVGDHVPHGGPVVAALGAVDNWVWFLAAIAAGTVVTALTTNTLIDLAGRRAGRAGEAPAGPAAPAVPRAAATGARPGAPAPEVLSGHLTGRTVKTGLAALTKEDAIREMAELLAAAGSVRDVDELVRVALAREAQGTTGLGESIAIPHAKTDAVSRPTVGFARSAAGIEWGAPDGTRARLVFMIAVPAAAAGDEHLRILALLSRKLMDAGFRDRLAGAPDERAVLEVLGEIR